MQENVSVEREASAYHRNRKKACQSVNSSGETSICLLSMTFDELHVVLTKWAPFIGGVGAFFIPFIYAMVKDARTRRIEAQKPHLERQLKLYSEACQVVVCIATATDAQKVAVATNRFWELYWGELCMVENRGVEKAMVLFGQALGRNAIQAELKDLSYQLSHALRRSLETTWGFRFRELLPY